MVVTLRLQARNRARQRHVIARFCTYSSATLSAILGELLTFETLPDRRDAPDTLMIKDFCRTVTVDERNET
jgi:hypothetical protein